MAQDDLNTTAQKALSAVIRLKQEKNVEYVVDFLRGSRSEKITEEHRQLKTFGVGANLSRQEWLNRIRDFVSFGFLKKSEDNEPVLQITEKGWRILRGEETAILKNEETHVSEKVKSAPPVEAGYEPDLLEELTQLRKYFAKREDIPSYMVLSDITLHELAVYLPLSQKDLNKITGFGEVKIGKFGFHFLKIIKEYCEVNELQSRMELKTSPANRETPLIKSADAAKQTLELFRQGIPISEIARLMQLSKTAVEEQLAKFIFTKEVMLSDIVEEKKVVAIKEAIQQTGSSSAATVKNFLGDDYSEGEIKAVLNYLQKSKRR